MSETKVDFWRRVIRATGALVFCAALLCSGAAHAQWWASKTFDSVIDELVVKLVTQKELEDQPVLVISHGFYDADTGLSLRLAGMLRDRVITALRAQNVRVFLDGTDRNAAWSLQVTWRRMGDNLLLDFKLVALLSHGPEAVASASGQAPLSTIDVAWLEADRQSWGRYLLRKLEGSAKFLDPKSLHVQNVRTKGSCSASTDLARYLTGWLKEALAESVLFKVVDPKRALMNMPVDEIRTRGIKLPATAVEPAPQDLTGDLLQADAELRGSAWVRPEELEIRAQICDRTGGQLTCASVDVPRHLFPEYIFKEPEGAPKPAEERFDECISRRNLTLELTTNAGALPEYLEGERAKFVVRANRDAYVYLFDINPDGGVVALYPVDEEGSLSQKPPCGRLHSAGVPVIIPQDGCSYDLKAAAPFGTDRIWALASETPLAIPSSLEGDWAKGDPFIRKVRELSAQTGTGYAEAFLDVVTRPK
jgi:hypothetical protein